MRTALLALCIAAFLVSGCTSKDWEDAGKVVLEREINKTVDNLNPFRQCEPGVSCERGTMYEVKCQNGKEVGSLKSDPHSCSGNYLTVYHCAGDTLSADSMLSSLECDYFGKVNEYACQGGALDVAKWDSYRTCSSDGAYIDVVSCNSFDLVYAKQPCPQGTSCQGTDNFVTCS